MSSRYALAAVMLLAAAAPASASILSATSQTVGARSSNAEYLRVNVVQDELNATMRDINDDATATGGVTASAPVVEGGAYVLQKDGPGGRPGINPKLNHLYSPDDTHEGGRLSVTATHGPRGHFDNNRGGNRDHRNDPHAAPEPSTWLLLGTGLAMLGGYTMIRRRAAVEI